MSRSADIDLLSNTINLEISRSLLPGPISDQNEKATEELRSFYLSCIDLPAWKDPLLSLGSTVIADLATNGQLKKSHRSQHDRDSVPTEIYVSDTNSSICVPINSTFLIGRKEGCDIGPHCGDSCMSRLQAIVIVTESDVIILDFWSGFGTTTIHRSNTTKDIESSTPSGGRRVLIFDINEHFCISVGLTAHLTFTARLCVVCLSEPRSVRLCCGHGVVCRYCAKKLNQCPICRADIKPRANETNSKVIHEFDGMASMCISDFKDPNDVVAESKAYSKECYEAKASESNRAEWSESGVYINHGETDPRIGLAPPPGFRRKLQDSTRLNEGDNAPLAAVERSRDERDKSSDDNTTTKFMFLGHRQSHNGLCDVVDNDLSAPSEVPVEAMTSNILYALLDDIILASVDDISHNAAVDIAAASSSSLISESVVSNDRKDKLQTNHTVLTATNTDKDTSSPLVSEDLFVAAGRTGAAVISSAPVRDMANLSISPSISDSSVYDKNGKLFDDLFSSGLQRLGHCPGASAFEIYKMPHANPNITA